MSLNRQKRISSLHKIAGDLYEFTIYDLNKEGDGNELSFDVVAQAGGKRYFLRLEPTGGITFVGSFDSLRGPRSNPDFYVSKLEAGANEGWVKKTEHDQISEDVLTSLSDFMTTQLEDVSNEDMGPDFDNNLKKRMTDPDRKDIEPQDFHDGFEAGENPDVI